ncbi:MAG: hypothetical protein GY810_13470 [Aureispira sp.]|nr:hypothetical protein [Aureispira sp.]
MKLLIFLGFSILVFNACQTEVNPPHNQEEEEPFVSYSAKEVDWSCQYPREWGQLVDMPMEENQTALLLLQKDEFNFMTSITEPFDSSLSSFNELNISTMLIMKAFYEEDGRKANVNLDKITIDGLTFFVIDSEILKKGSEEEVFMQQTMYNGLLNDTTALNIRISYNNVADKKILTDIIASSKIGKQAIEL